MQLRTSRICVLEFFTSIAIDQGEPAECMYVYSFGAPGYEKAPFDGLGRTIKNKIHSLIKAMKTSNNKGVLGVESG